MAKPKKTYVCIGKDYYPYEVTLILIGVWRTRKTAEKNGTAWDRERRGQDRTHEIYEFSGEAQKIDTFDTN